MEQLLRYILMFKLSVPESVLGYDDGYYVDFDVYYSLHNKGICYLDLDGYIHGMTGMEEIVCKSYLDEDIWVWNPDSRFYFSKVGIQD